MRADNFKAFIEELKHAESNSPLFYAGYVFLDLTPRQYNITVSLLRTKSYIKEGVANNGRPVIWLPNGVGLYTDKEV